MTCPSSHSIAALPPNERERLARLRALGVLDTAEDPELDQVTELVRMVFGVETALVSLVDEDRQWFKSRRGLDATETSRDLAFCAHAILEEDVFVVLDASKDARFRDNPLVASGPEIRFYAGAPLVTEDGFALGTLCAISATARKSFDAEERRTLAEMAKVALTLLTRRSENGEALDRLQRERQREADRIDQMTQVMKHMGQGAMLIDADGLCEYANPRAHVLLDLQDNVRLEGFYVDPMIDDSVERGLLEPELAQRYRAVVRGGDADSFDLPVPSGRILRCDVRSRPGGGCILTLSDMTEDRKRKEELRQSSHELRLLLDHLPSLVFHKDGQNNILQVNAAAAESLGMSRAEVEGQSCDVLYDQEVSAGYYADDLEVIRSGKPKLGIVEPYAPKDGEWSWISTDKIPYTDPVTGQQHVFVVATDISAQRNAEEAAKAQLAKLEALYNSAPAMLHTLDPHGVITSVSDFWVEVMGYERNAVIGRHFNDFVHPDSDDPFASWKIKVFTRTNIMKDDALRLVDASGQPIDVLASSVPEYAPDGSVNRVISVLTDVTELLSTKGKLAQAQKMESVGQLTSGLAHDFNNLLGVIVGNLQLIERGLDDPKARKRASAALSAADSGAELTRRLLAFSRKRDMDVGAVNVTRSLEEFDGMAQRLIGETVDLQTCLTPDLPPVVADVSQLESAVLNLCVNARDAMPDGGEMTLEARPADIGPQEAEAEQCEPGRYVKISVTDTGEGMDRDTLDKVLEPFFSTKDVGQGTGLGLSMVYAFVKQVGGFMRLYSEPGRGTTVSLFLRTAEAETPASSPARERDVSAGLPMSGRILVVEDQEAVRDVAVSLLEEMGFTTRTAESGDAALVVLESDPAFDLVFTDVVMPGSLDGVALAKAAHARWPDLPFVFATGYAEASLLRSGGIQSSRNLVNKPYRRETLAETIGDVLGQSRRAAADKTPRKESAA
ncbi:MAG: PAS domain S-box protein [Litorimonas sp.]